tara:strand:+ start:1521 stop:2705 length:1185 start_codon:yes stop_codon:yes gene_type:complete
LLNIVHFSRTPSAGSPIRLVQALRAHTDYNIHLIDLDRFGIYDHDIIFKEEVDRAIEIAKKADIIHFHHYIDINNKDFYPIDFQYLKKSGTLFLRHYRTEPRLTAQYSGVSIDDLYSKSIPSLVVGQYMERFYPTSMVVPNIIPEYNKLYKPNIHNNKGIYYSPTFDNSAWTHRWDTKGKPEVLKLLLHLKKDKNIKIISHNKSPLKDALLSKQSAQIIIDDIVTGSYHISTLEGLSMGKVVLSYLDNRTKYVISKLSGSDESPIINVHLNDAYKKLIWLLNNDDIILKKGIESRKWFEKYWSEKKMINSYSNIYKKLLNDPHSIVRQKDLEIVSEKQIYLSITEPEIEYRKRLNYYLKQLSLKGKFYYYCNSFFCFIKSKIKAVSIISIFLKR